MDPRRLDRLLALLRRHGVAKYSTADFSLELAPLAAPVVKPVDTATRAPRVDTRDSRSVDAFLKARLAPGGGSN